MMQGSLAERLRVLRARQGLSLTEASKRAGITRDTLSDLERGKRHAYMPTLAKIAEGYDVDVEELLEEPVPFLAEASGTGQPRSGPTAEGHLTVRSALEELGENQVREILAGVVDGRITVEEARQLVTEAS